MSSQAAATSAGIVDQLTVAHFDNDEARWAAVVARDPRADEAFCYAVCTTGIFCRPSCAARRPLQRNVVFLADADNAAAAGFRPCMRCRPHATSLSETNAAKVAVACRLIEAANEPPGLKTLAAAVGLSAYHFHRLFKAVTGVTPRAYAAAHRARRLREELISAPTVTAAMYDAGFNSSSRFYAAADGILGMRPRDFRAGGTDSEIRFALGRCSLGSILVAATALGVCAIALGDEPDVLVRDLRRRFANARLIGNDAAFAALVAMVVDFVETPAVGLELPLDLRGTVFQQRVWYALKDIPSGETRSYGEIAVALGAPAAARAVARACASNLVALAIPCHRAVRGDGALSGYRWGAERKRALLTREVRGITSL